MSNIRKAFGDFQDQLAEALQDRNRRNIASAIPQLSWSPSPIRERQIGSKEIDGKIGQFFYVASQPKGKASSSLVVDKNIPAEPPLLIGLTEHAAIFEEDEPKVSVKISGKRMSADSIKPIAASLNEAAKLLYGLGIEVQIEDEAVIFSVKANALTIVSRDLTQRIAENLPNDLSLEN